MQTSRASVNSALQRARKLVAERVPARSEAPGPRAVDDARTRELVTAYSDALDRGDPAALVALLTEDVTWSMPPLPHWYRGIETVRAFAEAVPLGSCGQWRHRAVSANGQPAVASWLRPDGAPEHTAWSIDVLAVRDGRIAEITSFIGREHFTAFGLPLVVS
jgi:RNA polymerase sigma-70 factor (ECF subfamily)